MPLPAIIGALIGIIPVVVDAIWGGHDGENSPAPTPPVPAEEPKIFGIPQTTFFMVAAGGVVLYLLWRRK